MRRIGWTLILVVFHDDHRRVRPVKVGTGPLSWRRAVRAAAVPSRPVLAIACQLERITLFRGRGERVNPLKQVLPRARIRHGIW